VNITHSSKISEIITNLAKRKQLKAARNLSIWSTSSSRLGQIEGFAKALSKKFGPLPDLVVGVATTSNTTFYFRETEEEVIQKLEAIPLKKKGKTAPKVLVRMIYTRLMAAKRAIDNLNECKARSGWYGKYASHNLTPENMCDPESYKSSTPDVFQVVEKVSFVANREDVTEDIRKQAWDLFQTAIIMDS